METTVRRRICVVACAIALGPFAHAQGLSPVNVSGGSAALESFTPSRVLSAGGGKIGSTTPSAFVGKQPPGGGPTLQPVHDIVATAICAIGQTVIGSPTQQQVPPPTTVSKLVSNFAEISESAPTAPLLYAVESADAAHPAGPKLVGRATGGDRLRLYGANLLPPRELATSHATKVFIHTSQATILEAESTSSIVVRTPPGLDSNQNPLPNAVAIRIEQTVGANVITSFFKDAFLYGPTIFNKTIAQSPPMQGITLYHVADGNALVFRGCDILQPTSPIVPGAAGNFTLVLAQQFGSAVPVSGSGSAAALELALIQAALDNCGVPNPPCPSPTILGQCFKISHQVLVIDALQVRGAPLAQWTAAKSIEIKF
jgi:hypothetical protein